MSGYKRYPKYRDSGVEWIGEVPEGWNVCKLAYRFSVDLGKMLDQKRITGKYPVPYLRNQDVQWGHICTDNLPLMDIAPEELQRYTAVSGDLLVCEGGDVGRAAIWDGDRIGYQKALHRLRALADDSVSLMLYLLTAAKAQGLFSESDSKSTISHLPAEQLRLYRFPFPPGLEQTAIVSYLDRATARIDALVAKKTRFIALLKEKRQALITHAVTKGLNPDAKMKDSGVEWIGEVPVGWKVTALKRLGILKGGSGFPIEMQGRSDNELPFYKVGDLAKSADGRYLGPTEHSISRAEAAVLRATIFPKNTLAWAKIGAALFLNRRRITNAACCLDNNMTGFTVSSGTTRTLFCYYLLSSLDFAVYARPGAVPSIPEGEQGEIQVPLPPPAEQAAIATYLDRATARIDKLVSLVERSIALLKEKRSALITAAVTGQIDVRGGVSDEVRADQPEELAA